MSSINNANTRMFPGADIGSNHGIILTNIKLKFKNKRITKNPRIRFDKLKDPTITEAFKAHIGGKFADLNIIDDGIKTTNTKSRMLCCHRPKKFLEDREVRFSHG